MTTSKKKEQETLTHLNLNSILISLIDLEIISTLYFASVPLVKNSEIDQENSQLYSMSVLSIGSYLGLKKP